MIASPVLLDELTVQVSHRLGFPRTPPAASGLRKELLKADVDAVEQVLTRWITDVLGELPDGVGPVPLAVDGKSLRGTRDRFGLAVHVGGGE